MANCVWTVQFLVCAVVLQLGTANQKLSHRIPNSHGTHTIKNTRQENPSKYCDPLHEKESASAITQRCAPGLYRKRTGFLRSSCVPCDCSGLSAECDQHTGKCLNCQFHTAGDHCERCKDGYYGNAAQRTCRVCPCPLSDPSRSYALGCLENGQEVLCLCKPGHAGSRCERCALGYHGDPLTDGQGCQPCKCHGTFCDQKTGECQTDEESLGCTECDGCTQTLFDDLEGMDDEFSKFKSELESVSGAVSHTSLEKLNDAITALKVQVRQYKSTVHALKGKVKELEADAENVNEDLNMLKDKGGKTLSKANKALKDTEETIQGAQDLLSGTEDLLKAVNKLLNELEQDNHKVPPNELARILKQARRMVEEMRKQNCKSQSASAEDEREQARKLLEHITTQLTDTLNGNQAAFTKTAQSLMNSFVGLQDLEELLKNTESNVRKTQDQNAGNKAIFEDTMKRWDELVKVLDHITRGTTEASIMMNGTKHLHTVLEDLKEHYEGIGAQIDGAKPELTRRLTKLSMASAKEGLIREAEKLAQQLNNVAMDFQTAVWDATNSSAVQKAVQVIKAYSGVTDAIRRAEAAAHQAKEAANQASKNVKEQDLTKKAKELSETADNLLSKAVDAKKDLKKAEEKVKLQQESLKRAKTKSVGMKQEIQAVKEKLKRIGRGETKDLIQMAKEAVAHADSTANAVTVRLESISTKLNKTIIPSVDSNLDNILSDVNKTLADLNQSIPPLMDKLNEMNNQSKQSLPNTDMVESIRRIKEEIEKTRDMANRIRGPILFSGNGHVELRPPKILDDLRAFTALNFTLHRPSLEGRRKRRQGKGTGDNSFVLYLGDKDPLKDYIGMVLRNNVLFCVYKLGGIVHEFKTSGITRSKVSKAFMDRVDFRRVYQDAEVIFTKTFTSSEASQLPPITSKPNTTVGILDLDKENVVFYVGGYPEDFNPPTELSHSMYRGCIELTTLNDQIIGLYNFQRAVNIKKTDKCLRGKVRQVGKYFDGTGYLRFDLLRKNRVIKFFILSRLEDALLYFMGNEDSYWSVYVERGCFVLQGRQGGQLLRHTSDKRVFPTSAYIQIKIILWPHLKVQVTDVPMNLTADYNHRETDYQDGYIGGTPASIRERHDISSIPPLRGCMNNFKVDETATQIEEVGIIPGCPNTLLGVREGTLRSGSSLAVQREGAASSAGIMISLGFRTNQTSNVLLETGQLKPGFDLSLVDGFVEMRDGKSSLRSEKRYNEGEWHYLTASSDGTGVKLTIDNTDMGKKLLQTTRVATEGNNIVFGKETFTGCLRNIYLRRPQDHYLPADMSSFIQTGSVTLGTCAADNHPLAILPKAPKVRSTQQGKRAKERSITKDMDSERECKQPTALIQADGLDGTSSQILYNVAPEELNYRPLFSMDVRTKSSEGLLLHILGKDGSCVVALYMVKGRVKLSVGRNGTIHHQKKINDGNWHNVIISVEQHTFHLLVDGFRVTDGQLNGKDGYSLDLQSPVYIGASQTKLTTGSQQERLLHKPVSGCIRDLKFHYVLMDKVAANHGVAPCFDGDTEDGSYFAGAGSYAVLEKFSRLGSHFYLTFEVRLRSLTGIIFYVRGQNGNSLAVFMNKGRMVVQETDGSGVHTISVSRHLTGCDNSFHHVTVLKMKNAIELVVDADSEQTAGPLGSTLTNIDKLYIGGISEQDHKKLPVRTSFVGCLRNIQLNEKLVSLKSVTSIFGHVSLTGCPAN